MSESLPRDLNAILSSRNTLLRAESIESVAEQAVELVREHVCAQVVSVFLFDKAGILRRIALSGFDRNDQILSNNSFVPGESYHPGEGLTGSAVCDPGSQLGNVIWWSSQETPPDVN